jgi:hypothetical protein
MQPLIKEFYQNFKVTLQETKNENAQLQKEAEQLIRDKIMLQQQISFAEKRTQELERFTGVAAKVKATNYLPDKTQFEYTL